MTDRHPGETAPGIPGATRYLCPLCDWWLDVPEVDETELRQVTGLRGWGIDQLVRHLSAQRAASIEGALAGHFATVQHRPQAANRYAAWTAESLAICTCGHPRGDHYNDHSCLHSTETETWACDCHGFEAR